MMKIKLHDAGRPEEPRPRRSAPESEARPISRTMAERVAEEIVNEVARSGVRGEAFIIGCAEAGFRRGIEAAAQVLAEQASVYDDGGRTNAAVASALREAERRIRALPDEEGEG